MEKKGENDLNGVVLSSKWDDTKFRREYEKQYMKDLKNGVRVPKSDKTISKWFDREFRRKYDKERRERVKMENTKKKVENSWGLAPIDPHAEGGSKGGFTPFNRPNYTRKQKEMILEKMIIDLRNGKDILHPHLELKLCIKESVKRKKSVDKNNEKLI